MTGIAISKRMRVVFAGGGSGGHVYPLLAVAEALKMKAQKQGIELELFYVGPSDHSRELFTSSGVTVAPILAGKIRRYFSIANLFDIPKFLIGSIQAMAKIFSLMPDAVFSKGGTGAFPVVFASWFFRIPVIIHESDAVPGMNNSISSIFAKKILLSFKKTLSYFPPPKGIVVGNPTRPHLDTSPKNPEEAKRVLGLDPQKPAVVFIGGSQGAQVINEFVLENLEELLKKIQIIHQTGQENFTEVERLAKTIFPDAARLVEPKEAEVKPRQNIMGDEAIPEEKPKVRPYWITPYLEDELGLVFQAADVVVSRAGSGSISTIAAFGKPSILIPIYGSANDHQRINAYEYAGTGAAVVIEEQNLAHALFLEELEKIMTDKARMEGMASAAKAFLKPDAAENIATEIFSICNLKIS